MAASATTGGGEIRRPSRTGVRHAYRVRRLALSIAPSSIWIAGVGAVSSAGGDVRATIETFGAQRRNVSAAVPFEGGIAATTFRVACELPALPAGASGSRTLRLAMRATNEALADAGVGPFEPGCRVGICIGTTVASQLNCIPFYDAYRRHGHPDLSPVYDFLGANLGAAVGGLLGVRGPRMTIVNACSSGADAIGVAAGWIRAGLCDVALAGGADELNRVALAGFWSLGVMSATPCAPFDRDRAGLNLGEGAGMVVLESAAHAQRRGARRQFELAGFGAACDAHHLTAPHPDGRGLESAIRQALGQARIDPSRIAFVNAHGTATADNDRAEGRVIHRIFGDRIPFLSTKGFTGHTLGAAGGLEAIFTLLGLRSGWIPASAGFENQAADIPLSPVRERTAISGDYAMSTSLAFGGNNAALIIRRGA